MKTILITAYAINPFKGSEDGTGWNITYEIAQDFNVLLFTRKNNVPHVQKYLAENSDDPRLSRIKVIGFDLKPWVLKIKKRTGTKSHVVYYYLWQYFISKFIQKKKFKFDLVHCLNFHSDSHPHFFSDYDVPVVWGPIGHHPVIPKNFVKSSNLKSQIIDRAFYVVKWAMRNLNPKFKKAVSQTDKILVINSSIRQAIGARNNKTMIIPAVAAKIQKSTSKARNADTSKFEILSAGRFHFMKGFDVTIHSFAKFVNELPEEQRHQARLTLVGKGPEKESLQNLAAELGVSEFIHWVDWIDHSEMENLYQNSDVFLFPSHEGAGMVVPEAMSYGLPVLAFDNVGPGELVNEEELLVPYSSYDDSILAFANKLSSLHKNPTLRSSLGQKMKTRQQKFLNWTYKGNLIRNQIHQLLQKQLA